MVSKHLPAAITALSAPTELVNVASKLLDVPVHTDEVVEIDDGIKPWYFHVCEDCVKVLPFFDAERAKQNKYDDTEE